MDQRLQNAAESGDIDSLYVLLNDDPNVLEGIDKIPFVKTPLHVATAGGHTHFALELMRLKPSFSTMLNRDGRTAMDLALRNGHIETVRRLASYKPELIRGQGREGITPLHYVAEINDDVLFAEFLFLCPASVEDLTIRGQTAAHIAAENGSFNVLKVLAGWLHRVDQRVDILDRRDEEGNTVLHIAARKNDTQVFKLLLKKKDLPYLFYKRSQLNYKNLEGFTALDIVTRSRDDGQDTRIAKSLLVKAGASKASSLPNMVRLAGFLCKAEKTKDNFTKVAVYLSFGLSGELRNAMLVVAVLVATATFQAVLQPPGGFSQADLSNPFIYNTPNTTTITTNNNVTSSNITNRATEIISQDYLYRQFIFWNTITFSTSLAIICVLLPPNIYEGLLYIIAFYLMVVYVISAMFISQSSWTNISLISSAILGGSVSFFYTWPFIKRARIIASRRLIGNNDFHDLHGMRELVCLSIYSSTSSSSNM